MIACSVCGRTALAAYLLPSARQPQRVVFSCGEPRHVPRDGRGCNGDGVMLDRWRAHVAYVPSAENRSHGATLGLKLRRFCDGTRFRYVFY